MPLSTRPGVTVLCLALCAAVPAVGQAPAPPPAAGQAPAAQQTRGDTLPPHEMRRRTFHATHYALRLRVDQARQTLSGTATVTLAPFADGFRTLSLDAAGLTVSRVTLAGQSAPLPFQMADDHLDVTLDHPYKAGEPLTVAVQYQAVHPKRGAWFIPAHPEARTPRVMWTQGEDEDSRYWFPCYDYPNDKATTEIWATVDAGDATISNGRLVEQTKNADGTRTDHWVESAPHSTYLTSLIVGPYEKVTDHLGPLEVSYYGYRDDGDRLRRSFGMTPDIIAFYQTALGIPYPYEKYAQTVVPDYIFGGMENISATTQTDRALHGPGGEPDDDSTDLAAHELAHQWFGDLVTCRDWADAWLNEGFATYFAALYTEHARGRDAFQAEMRRTQAGYFSEDARRWRRPLVDSRYNAPMDLFDSHTYDKGAAVLHMLRFVLGDAGFFRSLHRYLTEHAYQGVDTEDLRRACEAETGQSLGWFFDQWAYHGGFPVFKVTHTYDDADHTVRVTVAQTQTEDPATGTLAVYRTPVEIGLLNDGGMTTRRVEITAREQTFVLPAPARPRAVLFDPSDWLLTLEAGGDAGRDEWVATLAHAPTVVPRLEAAQALGAYRDDSAAEAALAGGLAHDPFAGVRAACARALADVTAPGAEAALLQADRSEADVRAREAVLEALGSFTDPPARTAVRDALGDFRYGIQAAAIAAAVRQKATDVYPRLEAIVAASNGDSAYDRVRAGALGALLVPSRPQALGEALAYLAPSRPEALRQAAVRSLEKLAPERADVTARLAGLLREAGTRPFFRRTVIAALQARGDARAVAPLRALAAARETDTPTREAAAAAADGLVKRGTPDARIGELERQVRALAAQNADMKARLDTLDRAGRPAPPSPGGGPRERGAARGGGAASGAPTPSSVPPAGSDAPPR